MYYVRGRKIYYFNKTIALSIIIESDSTVHSLIKYYFIYFCAISFYIFFIKYSGFTF